MTNTIPDITFMDNHGQIQLSAEDAAIYLIENIDFDSQKYAILKALKIIEKAINENSNEILKLENEAKGSSGKKRDFLVDELVDEYHYSVYFDAANSMSSVGMIAPTIESIMYEVFQNIGKKFGVKILNENSLRKSLSKKYMWDCHYYMEEGKSKKNIVKGIMQLLQDTQLNTFLPSDFDNIIDALFSYRNNIFHNGFEWPKNIKDKFQKKINDSNWPDTWFSCSTSNNEPWIFYMTDKFQNQCLKMLDEVYIVPVQRPISLDKRAAPNYLKSINLQLIG